MTQAAETTTLTTATEAPPTAAPDAAAPPAGKSKVRVDPGPLPMADRTTQRKAAKAALAAEFAKLQADAKTPEPAAETPAAAEEAPAEAAPPEAKPDEAPAAEPEPPKPAAEVKPPPEVPEPELPKTDANGRPIKASITKQAERYKRQGFEALQEARAVYDRMQQEREQDRRERQQLEQQLQEERQRQAQWDAEARKDWQGALAKRLNVDPRALLTSQADKQANQIPVGVAAELADLRKENAAIREEFRQREEAKAKAERDAAEAARQNAHQNDRVGDIRKVIAASKAEEFADEYPHFAALETDDQVELVNVALDGCIRHHQRTGEKLGVHDILQYLEEKEARRTAAKLKSERVQKRYQPQASPGANAPAAVPATPKAAPTSALKPDTESTRAPTKRDAAVPAAIAAPQTHAERKKLARGEIDRMVQAGRPAR